MPDDPVFDRGMHPDHEVSSPARRMISPARIAAYLATLPHTSDIKPYRVQIGRSRWPAARYRRRLTTLEGARDRMMIYAVGPLPATYRQSSRVVFTIAREPHEWYVASHYPHDEPNEIHPFGQMVLFAPWDFKDAIDRYQPRPYRRVPLVLIKA